MTMSTIDPRARFETLDFDAVDAALVRGRKLQAQAIASALKALFSRKTRDQAEGRDVRLPDCTAAA
ncbi:MAG: hypothetical protein ACR2RE_27215 [Geminicoccaceae bacterium]